MAGTRYEFLKIKCHQHDDIQNNIATLEKKHVKILVLVFASTSPLYSSTFQRYSTVGRTLKKMKNDYAPRTNIFRDNLCGLLMTQMNAADILKDGD
jgi:hypothetical protein